MRLDFIKNPSLGFKLEPLTAAGATALAAGLGAVGTLAGTAAQIGATTNLNKKNREWQEAMYNRQRQDALSDYMMQREWNSLPNQVKLAKEAGINPNTLAGNFSMPNTDVRSSDIPSAPQFNPDFSGVSSAMHTLSSGVLNASQIQLDSERNEMKRYLLENENLKIISEIQKNLADVDYTKSSKTAIDLDNLLRERTLDIKVQKLQAELDGLLETNALTFQKTIQAKFQNEHLNQAELNKINAGIDLINAQIQDYKSLWVYREQLVAESASKQALNQVDTLLHQLEYDITSVTGGGKWMKEIYGAGTVITKTFGSVISSMKDYASGAIARIKTAAAGDIPRVPSRSPVPNMLDSYNHFYGR